jgi:hypothetical protein
MQSSARIATLMNNDFVLLSSRGEVTVIGMGFMARIASVVVVTRTSSPLWYQEVAHNMYCMCVSLCINFTTHNCVMTKYIYWLTAITDSWDEMERRKMLIRVNVAKDYFVRQTRKLLSSDSYKGVGVWRLRLL